MSLVFLAAFVEPSGLPCFLLTIRQDSVLSCESVGSVAILELLFSGFLGRRASSGAVDGTVISASGTVPSSTTVGSWAGLGAIVSGALQTAVGTRGRLQAESIVLPVVYFCAGRSWN